MDNGEGKIVVRQIANKCFLFTALVLVMIAPVTHSEELARLFFSAPERQALSQKRLAPPKSVSTKSQTEIAADANANEDVSESVVLPPPKITGRVVRSSGNNTIWVNHSPNYVINHSPRRSRD
jgi:hypothetical protein